MKRKGLALSLIFALLFAILAGTHSLNVAEANPIPWLFNPQMTITIQSPSNGTTSALPVLVSFTSQGDGQFSVSDDSTQSWVRSFFYVLDGQNMSTSGMRFAGTKTTTLSPQYPVYRYNFSGQAYLTNLTNGPHTITVYYGAVNNISYVGSPEESIYYNPTWSTTSQFYVITPTPSPEPTPVTEPLPASLVTASVSIVVVSIGLLVYFKKRK